MRSSSLGLIIVGVLLLLAGAVFALQGDGIIGGSSMTGVPFWIYAGSVIAIIGVIFVAFGFVLASRTRAGGVAPVQPK